MSAFARLNRRYLLRYRLEYVGALCVLYGVRALSPEFAWRCARFVGRLLYRLGVRRKVLAENLAVAFPEKSPQEREAMARATLEHFCSMVLDVVFQKRMLTEQTFLRRIQVTGWAKDYLAEHGREGLRRRASRTLFLTAHLGNWELASGFFALLGVSIVPVFRRPQNPFLDRLLRRIRLESLPEMIERRGAVSSMLEHFDRGHNVGFLFDQEALHGIYVPFFGLEACTHKTPAVLARDHGVKVFFGVLVRRGDFLRYEARGRLVEFATTEDREQDLLRITTELNGMLEKEIRLNPTQYLWMHRRWKRSGVHGLEHVSASRRKEIPLRK